MSIVAIIPKIGAIFQTNWIWNERTVGRWIFVVGQIAQPTENRLARRSGYCPTNDAQVKMDTKQQCRSQQSRHKPIESANRILKMIEEKREESKKKKTQVRAEARSRRGA